MTERIEAIRARHAARLRTRATKHDGTTQMSTLLDDDMAVLLAELDHVQGVNDDLNHEVANCRVLEYEARMKEAEAYVDRLRLKGIEDARLLHIEINRRDEALQRVRTVLNDEWGMASIDGTPFDEDFAEAVRENGAWRLARDLRAALAPVAPDAEPGGAS